ncbi:hypothetical protein, partial [Chamaesiphon sp. VAR_48_metabat_403]|uniref:hypothetical protein n=1 Tax=Chamaesiphon sp. VAR_48_metabat_403 TaxID=2964700 RepID=UPI00286DBEB7
HLSRHKCRLKGERNFVWARPNFMLQPNLQILALSQFQLSSLEEATPTSCGGMGPSSKMAIDRVKSAQSTHWDRSNLQSIFR